MDGWPGFNGAVVGNALSSRQSTNRYKEVHKSIRKSKERPSMSIVTLLVIIVLVLLAIYLFRRVF